MKYVQPLGEAEGTSYIDGDSALGISGSIPPAAAVEHPQREIVNVITAAGLTPDENDVGQLSTAIQGLVTAGSAAYAYTDMSNVPTANVVSKISSGGITSSHIASGAVTTNHMVDDFLTLSKLAHGTANSAIGFDGSGNPTEIDMMSLQADLLDTFATKVLVDLNVTEASNSYGTYHLQDMTLGGMTLTGGGSYVNGTGYRWSAETNVLLGAPVVASSTDTGSSAANAVDGNDNTVWRNAAGTYPHTIHVDVGVDNPDYTKYSTLTIKGGSTYGLGDFKLYRSPDAVTWTFVGNYPGNGPSAAFVMNVSDSSLIDRYYQVECNASSDGGSYSEVAEISLLGPGAVNQMVLTSSGISLSQANPTDIALYVLVNETAAVTEGVDRIFEIAEGTGGSLGTFITPSSILNLGQYLGQTLVRATFDVTSKPSSTYTYRISLDNVEQVVSSAVLVPLYY